MHVMKNKTVLFALIISCLPCLHADTLLDARARFASGEYEQAARLFEQSLEQQVPNAGVFYELGRAFSKAGNNARAALSFRRALILDPRFSAARSALRESEMALGISPPGKTDWRDIVIERMPMDFLTLAGTAIFWIGAFWLLLAVFRSRRGFSWGASLILIGLLVLALVWLCDPRITHRAQAMVLTHGGTTVLNAPADQSEKIANMPEGGVVRLLSQRGRWFYGELPTGTKGWFLTEGIVPVIPPS